MSLEDFINSISLEDLKIINEEFIKRQKQIPSYSYSKMTMETLKKLITIKQKFEISNHLNEWLNNDIKISNEIEIFLQEHLDYNKILLSSYSEEDLKINFIAPIIQKINFFLIDIEIRNFYEAKLTYKTENFILTGTTDFIVSKGIKYSEKPYFFIQEFKKSEAGEGNTETQLLAELISAVELNNWTTIKGAYIIGELWYFVVLEKLEKHNYHYYVSESFNSSKIADLKAIYKNLLYVKNEIIEIVNNEIDNE